jgi:WD40 repeat protein
LTDPASRGVQAIAFAPSGALLATGDATGATYLWNTAPGAGYSRRTLADPGATGTYGTVAVAFSADSATLAAGGYTGQTYLWDTASATRAATLSDPDSASQDDDIQAVVFSPRATSLATGNTRGRVYLWTQR